MDKIKTANILLIVAIVMVGICIYANRDRIFGSKSVASDSAAAPAPASTPAAE